MRRLFHKNTIGMIRKILFSIFLFCFTLSFGQNNDSIRITCISNSGYFIELGDKNILIDAIFNQCIGNYSCPDSTLIENMIQGDSPFDKVDFVLVTHNHPDHVEGSLLIKMLQNRSDFELILPQQVYNSIKDKTDLSQFKNRIHAIELDGAETAHITIRDTQFEIARSKHAESYEIENLCYIINNKGFRILHTGDIWPESIVDIDKKYFSEIDLAIIPLSFGKDGFAAYDTILSPRYTLLSHIKKDFKDRFKEIIKTDTLTFKTKDVLFESYEQIIYKR